MSSTEVLIAKQHDEFAEKDGEIRRLTALFAASATGKSVEPVDVLPATDGEVFRDYRRRCEYAFGVDETRRRRALDFYMQMLGTDNDTLTAVVRQCANKVAPTLSLDNLMKLGVPRKLSSISMRFLENYAAEPPCQKWRALAMQIAHQDADQYALTSAAKRRLKRAYVASVQAAVAAAIRTVSADFAFASSRPDIENGSLGVMFLLNLLVHAYHTLATELLREPRVRAHAAARCLFPALSIARVFYGPMSPHISVLLNTWYDINESIGPRRDPQCAWWHNSIVADWHQRIQARESPTKRAAWPNVDFSLWSEWTAAARASRPGRARIAERVQRRAVRLWWRTADVRSMQNAPHEDWVALAVWRVIFNTERCCCDRRTSARLARRLGAPLREAEYARVRYVAPDRPTATATAAANLVAIDRRIAQVRLVRGVLRLRAVRVPAYATHTAVGDLRASHADLWALVRASHGNSFDTVCSLAAATVSLMETLHLLGAYRQLTQVAQTARPLTALLAAHQSPTCESWKLHVATRSAAACWNERARTLTSADRGSFRQYTVAAVAAIETARRVEPRVAVGSFILESFSKRTRLVRRPPPPPPLRQCAVSN